MELLATVVLLPDASEGADDAAPDMFGNVVLWKINISESQQP